MTDDDEADLAAEVRSHLLGTSVAALGTIGAQRGVEGYPFGSVVPYACSAEGHLLVLLARIATHTANLRKDPRASLLVRDPAAVGDPQASWRVTVLGPMERVMPADVEARAEDAVVERAAWEELFARYRERVPDSGEYEQTHDFDLWRLREPVRVRYIGGFGKIHWLPGPAVLRDPGGSGLREAAPSALAHLDADHAHNLVELCAGLHGFTPASARALAVDRTGLTLRAAGPDRVVHCSFGREIDAAGLRGATVELVRRARARS